MINFLYGSMKVYTEAGAGKPVAIGSCKIKREGAGYCVRISEKLYRLSATGIFFLKPPRLFLILHRGELIKVRAGGMEKVVPVQLMIAIEGKIC